MVRLNVTATNISEGRHSDGRRCPIALAARGAGLSDVVVLPEEMFWGEGEGRQIGSLPAEVVAWQRRYDLGGQMPPITFELEGRRGPGTSEIQAVALGTCHHSKVAQKGEEERFDHFASFSKVFLCLVRT